MVHYNIEAWTWSNTLLYKMSGDYTIFPVHRMGKNDGYWHNSYPWCLPVGIRLCVPHPGIPWYPHRLWQLWVDPHTQQCLKKFSGSISIGKPLSPLLQRLHDDYTMEHITGCTKTTPKEWLLDNKCRLWMRVITIADLASINGRTIPIERLKGQWKITPIPGFTWPKQPEPRNAHCSTFRQCLGPTFCTTVSPWQMSGSYNINAVYFNTIHI